MPLKRRSLTAAAIAASALLPPAAAPRAQSEDKLEKVEILLDWKALPTYAGFYLARQMGAFERRGLEVKFAETQGALSSAAMVGEGRQYWIGASSGIATAIGRSKGQPIKSLAVYYQKTPTVIFTRTEDRIAHPRDLYGKTLGLVPGSITNEELRALVAANKLDRSMVTVAQQLSGPPTCVQTRAGWEATIETLETLNLLTKPITVDEVAIFN